MRLVTPARLRAAGLLLLEVAGLGLIVAKRVSRDDELRSALVALFKKVRPR